MICFLNRVNLRRWTRRSESQRPSLCVSLQRAHGCNHQRFHGTDGLGGLVYPDPAPAFATFDETNTLPAHFLHASFIQRRFVSSRLSNWSAMVAAVDAVAASSSVRYPLQVDQVLVLANLKQHAILGAGSFGQVYLVSEKQPDGSRRACAVKVQKKADRNVNRIVQEMFFMKKLQHPFLVNLEASFEDQYHFYFKMPLLQGGDLSDRVLLHATKNKYQHGLPEEHAKFYALCIADALAYMHGVKCMHRDLKPSNVMIDSQGYPVIVDLGLATFLPEGRAYDPKFGTRYYMAPEVVYAKNDKGYGCNADHWSFGALVFTLVTGHSLYHGLRPDKHWKSRLVAVSAGKIKFPKDVSHNFVDLVRKLLVKNPKHRLGSLEGGEQDILEHPWFDGLDIVSLRQRKFANVPWVPTIKDPLDTSNFPDCKPL